MSKYKNSFFKRFDIFGIHPLFTIRGKTTFQTQIGSFITFICFFLIIIYISYFLYEMINHVSPNFNSTILYEETPPEVQLMKNNFSFVFGLQTKDYINYIDESIYKVNGFQTIAKLNEKGNYDLINQPLKIIKCNEYQFNIVPGQFKKLPLQNLYCLDSNINLKGENMRDWNYIRLNFSKCENSTENNNSCKSENEINELLNGGYIGISIPDYSLELIKYNNPNNIHVRNLYKSFSIKYFEDIFLYFKLVQIVTDSGYFFENKNYINFTTYDYIQNDIDFRASKYFLALSIRISSKREIHMRNYIKLQTIFSNVGGMIKLLLIIGDYFVFFIRMTLYKNYILEFFNLDESEIRLKKIRKLYKLRGNFTFKNNINSIFPNLNSIDNNVSFKFNKNLNKIHSSQNIKFPKTEEKSDSQIFFNNNDLSENNKELNNSKNEIYHRHTVKNNFLVNNDFIGQRRMKNDNFTKTLLHRPKGSSLFKNINLNDMIPKNNFVRLKTTKFITDKSISPRAKYSSNSILSGNESGLRKKKKNNNNKIKNYNIYIPKTQLRVIKVPGFCSDFICKKNTFRTIKQVHENYKEIQFLLDIVHYLKSQNELNIIGKFLFSEEQRKALSYTYTFEADFGLERNGYEYMIKHKKNKFDDKEKINNSHSNLLGTIH